MNDNFKTELLNNLSSAIVALDKLLKTEGSITDVSAIDRRVVGMSTDLLAVLTSYDTTLRIS